ncbi:calcium-binding protein [Nannocystis sp. RBIL2]|uniref:calcium-binding protein n=1 Tax=Nannocystis sp. RBIL2 TaxID=2996788 RepID=UPI00226D59B1|nr:calcium-binding protein [Nannocystis sp. RBIL2]MCY1069985.1 calcium-binding protein [Nannocystis sp. RBIL2]
MLSPRIVLSLALLPALVLAPGCDEKQGPGPNTGDVADDTTTDGPDSGDSPDGPPEPDTTDGEGATTSQNPDEPVGHEEESESEGDDEPQPPPPQPEPRPEAVEVCPDLEWPHTKECTTEGGEAGSSMCFMYEGEEHWTECSTEEPVCDPNYNWDMGCIGEICAFDGTDLYLYSWAEDECDTPLVVNFDGAPLRFEAAAAASFDISGAGQCLSTDWPTLPWLALDRDRDGAIDSGRELFGSGTVLSSGRRASHGFEALAEHDLNRDGKIDRADPVFAELVLWSDGDRDRRGELSELVPVAQAELVAIHLDVAVRAECDDRGNCGRERARFEFKDVAGQVRSGEVVDVYLACQ